MNLKIDNEDILKHNRKKEFAHQEHIAVYTLALCYLGLYDKAIRRKTAIWNKFMLAETKEEKKKYYQKLLVFKSEEKKVIINALNKIEEEAKSQDSYYAGNLWIPNSWGILSFERNAE